MKIISFDNTRKGIATNAIIGFLFQFLIKLKGLLILPMVVHFLSKETLGEWRLISTTVMIILPLISLNVLDGSGMFFSADLEKRRVQVKYYSLVNFVIVLSTFASFLLLFLSFTFDLWEEYILPIVLLFYFTVLKKLAIFLFQTYQKSKILLKVNIVAEYGAATLSLILMFYGIRDIYALLFPILIVNFALALVFFLQTYKEITYKFFFSWRFIKTVFPVSIPLIPVYITEWILSSIGIYFLQFYYNTEVVGSYSVLLSIASLLLALRATLQFFWFSTCSNLLGIGKIEQFKKMMKEVIKIYLVLSILALTIYGFFSTDLITLFANKEYHSINRPLYITAFGYIFLIFSTIWNGILYSIGKSKQIMWSYVYAAAGVILLSFVLVKPYGLLGASLAYTCGNIILFIRMFLAIKEVHFSFSSKEKLVLILLIPLLIVSSLSNTYIIDDSTRRIMGAIFCLSIIIGSYRLGFANPLSLIKIIKK